MEAGPPFLEHGVDAHAELGKNLLRSGRQFVRDIISQFGFGIRERFGVGVLVVHACLMC